jgi:hypothetical protein
MRRTKGVALRASRLLITLGGAAALAGTASAHHGFGSFDGSADLMTLEGVVTGVDFINPHSWVYFTVTDESGEEINWRCEMRAATVLQRSGWTPEMFPDGERITLLALPDTRDPRSCYLSNVTFEDGRSYNRYAQIEEVIEELTFENGERPQRLANGDLNISGDWAPIQMLLSDPKVGGVTLEDQPRPVRGPGGFGGGPRPEPVQLTDAGQAVLDATDLRSPEGNPRFRCDTTSIVFDWNWDGSINRVTQRGDTITLEHGQHGFTRTIHMNMAAHPDDIELSRGGHSIGHWEDDVLVVDTVGFLPGLLTGQLLHSDQLHVVERFALDTGTMALTRSYTADDPLHFIGQHTGSDTLYVADAPFAVHGCVELKDVDYSVEGQETAD